MGMVKNVWEFLDQRLQSIAIPAMAFSSANFKTWPTFYQGSFLDW